MKQLLPNPEWSALVQLRKTVFRGCKNRQRLLTVTLLAGVLTTTTLARAQLQTWNGEAGDTSWSSDGNWLPIGVPGPSVNVRFTNDGVSGNPFVLGGSVNNVVDGFFTSSIN